MAVRPLPERGCVIHPTLGLMYNLTGAQSGLSHGLPLCSPTAWPALLSFLKPVNTALGPSAGPSVFAWLFCCGLCGCHPVTLSAFPGPLWG